MEAGKPSRTAWRVAIRRAIHQILDQPCVLSDPLAVPLIGPDFAFDHVREMHPLSRSFRAFMAVRSRYVEDKLAEAVAAGISQYVILGAGLDTFAYRNQFPALDIFEVDFPATQAWKRNLLAEANISIPSALRFVPLDFEHHTLIEGLSEANFDFRRPAYFGWLGVVPYLTQEAFSATLAAIASLPTETLVSFDYGQSPETLPPRHRAAFDAMAERVARAGEPFRLFFTSQQMESQLHNAGLQLVEEVDAHALNVRYFNHRSDDIRLSEPGMGRMLTARVPAQFS